MKQVNLMDFASLFVFVAKAADIEQERQRLEAEHDMPLAVFDVEHPTLSGTRCTRVSWMEDTNGQATNRTARATLARAARGARRKKQKTD